MIQEKSCGAVIYVNQNGELKFLIQKMQKGHVSLCKGHVEAGETEQQTARREIMEETALQVDFIEGFRESISYSPYPGCMKEVVFFLARAKGSRTQAQEAEVAEIYWLDFASATEALTHDGDREILEKAMKFLEEQNSF